MSLLLRALQKAAKDRTSDGEDAETAATTLDSDASLSLEPLTEPQLGTVPESSEAEADAGAEMEIETAPSASREQAANVMQVNEAPKYSALDWVGDHHMLSFLASATLFAIFYGLYVYLQVANPNMFRSSPPPVTAPIQSTTAAPPIALASAPAQISGLPNSSAPQGTTTDTQMADAKGIAPPAGTASVATDAGNNGANATVADAKKPAPPPRANQATPRSTPVRVLSAANDDVEVIEIPASPSVSTVPKRQSKPDQDISVQQRAKTGSQLDSSLMLAYEGMQLGEYEKAETLYNQVLAQEPNTVDAMLGLAAIAWKQGQTTVASRHYGRVLELEPRNSYGQAGLIALLGNADPIAAESKLKQLIGREPSGFLYFTLGNLYAEQDKWTRAQLAYFQAYQFQPNNSDYAFNLAVGLEHLGQTRLALQYYRNALDLSFEKGRANFDQGLAIERVGQLSARVE